MIGDTPNPYRAPPANGDVSPGEVVAPVINPHPAVKTWQIVYVILMMLLYLAVTVGGVLLILFREKFDAANLEDEAGMLALGLVYSVIGLGLFMVFGIGLFWRRGMGGWVFNLVLICIGLTSCCTWPMTIPLLIFWIKHKNDVVFG